MRKLSHLTLICLCTLSTMTTVRGATPEQVDEAIAKGKKYLYSQMNAGTGTWETDPKALLHGSGHMWGGYTSIATYALLASGESHQDPRLQKALTFLKTEDIDLMYALGLRAQIWALLPESPEVKKLVKRDGDIFTKSINKKDGPLKGLYHYGLAKDGPWHNSTAQYGVLGMWACEQAGYEVSLDYWQLVEGAWRKNQGDDGGWSYNVPPGPKNPEIATMTAAGIATLYITNEYLHANDGLNCKGNLVNANIENGLNWMGRHFGEIGGNTYGLYGIERIGVASGRKYFGKVDWFAVGAQTLLSEQAPTGAIDGGFGPVAGTSFALVFLSRGRAPVAINKLEYSIAREGRKPIEANWDQRPRDVANLVRWTGKNMEQDLNWQVVNLSVSADDLHDSPILYLSGDQALNFTTEEQAKLKDFVESGGMILGNPDCGATKAEFTQSFEKLGTTLFGAEFRNLGATHPIFSEQYHGKSWRELPKLRGLSNGVREYMLMLPETDPARAWQTRADQTRVQMFELGADVIQYAADKQGMRDKGDSYIIRPDAQVATNRTMKVARLQIGDNWNPEPGGWRRVAALMHNQFNMQVDVEPVKLVDQPLRGYQFAHLTGTTPFKLTEDQRARLLEFTAHGGTLLVDAAGGAGEFADAAEAELKTIFGTAATKAFARPLPLTDPLYSGQPAKITAVGYRPYAKAHLVGNLKNPRVVGIMHGNRVVAFYSREDLSAGMVGNSVDGLNGYSPATATDIVRNILLMTGPKPPPPPAPPQPAKPVTPAPALPPAAAPTPPAAPVPAPPAAAK